MRMRMMVRMTDSKGEWKHVSGKVDHMLMRMMVRRAETKGDWKHVSGKVDHMLMRMMVRKTESRSDSKHVSVSKVMGKRDIGGEKGEEKKEEIKHNG